jgi:hypothetical protein
VAGRRHADLQTEAYLEELADAPPEADGASQTDAFQDRPSTPLFLPPLTGTDAATQIENDALVEASCSLLAVQMQLACWQLDDHRPCSAVELWQTRHAS